MDTVSNLYIDVEKYDYDSTVYIKPMLFYKVVRSMGVYHKKADGKKRKIVVKSPKMIVPFEVRQFDNKGKKTFKMCLSFSTLTNLYNEEQIKQFYNFVRKMDRTTRNTVLENREKWGLPEDIEHKRTLKRTSSDYPYHMNVSLPYDENAGFLFNVYDEDGKKSKIDIIKKKSIVTAVLELTDIKFSNTGFRCDWTVLQIRKSKPYSQIQEFFMTNCMIWDDDDPDDPIYKQLTDRFNRRHEGPLVNNPAIHNPTANSGGMAPPPPPPPPSSNKIEEKTLFIPPTKDELMDAMKKLKKIGPPGKKKKK